MKTISQYLGWLLLVAFAGAVAAADAPPDALVKSTVQDVLAVMRQSKDRKTLRQLAEQKVLPRFDFKQMTQLAMGPAWRKANPEQQHALEESFRELLVNTYTSSLRWATGGDRTVEVRPVPQSGQKDVTVRTVVKESGKPPLSIEYRMENNPDGWKVYDVLVEGVSLVTTYRGTFSEEVAHSGIDGLIKSLQEKNRSLAKS